MIVLDMGILLDALGAFSGSSPTGAEKASKGKFCGGVCSRCGGFSGGGGGTESSPLVVSDRLSLDDCSGDGKLAGGSL